LRDQSNPNEIEGQYGERCVAVPLGRMQRKTHSQSGFAWVELLVLAAILLMLASFVVRLRYGHAWLAAEYSFVQSLGISRDIYDICKIAVLVIVFIGYAAYRVRRDRQRL
jgi:hypothetical protein